MRLLSWARRFHILCQLIYRSWYDDCYIKLHFAYQSLHCNLPNVTNNAIEELICLRNPTSLKMNERGVDFPLRISHSLILDHIRISDVCLNATTTPRKLLLCHCKRFSLSMITTLQFLKHLNLKGTSDNTIANQIEHFQQLLFIGLTHCYS